MITGIVIGIGIACIGLALAAFEALAPNPSANRLRKMNEAADAANSGLAVQESNSAAAFMERIGRLTSGANEKEPQEATIAELLLYAGYKRRGAADVFNGLRFGGFLVGMVLASPVGAVASLTVTLFAVILFAAIGYYLPLIVLRGRAEARQDEISMALPDALDLLVISVEAGLGLDAALRRVAAETAHVSKELSRELLFVTSETATGIDRITALKHLYDRTGIDEIRSLVNMLAQAERFGSPVSDSLRLYSSVAREKRMARAEEIAGGVSSKLTVVMIVCLMPVLMLVLIGPPAIRWFAGDM